MVNASLNWASIVGIVLAVGGTMLYFLRTFKPGLARDYDVFFAAVGLLCGGILFFQGWRLDPILQFGQFLLAATTVFFAYESVRLRSVPPEQARRSAYFDDDEPLPSKPRMGRGEWGSEDRFDDPQPLRRRIRSRGDDEFDEPAEEEDFYRPRRPERRAIPERAQSRFSGRSPEDDERSDRPEPTDRGRAGRYSAPREPRLVDGFVGRPRRGSGARTPGALGERLRRMDRHPRRVRRRDIHPPGGRARSSNPRAVPTHRHLLPAVRADRVQPHGRGAPDRGESSREWKTESRHRGDDPGAQGVVARVRVRARLARGRLRPGVRGRRRGPCSVATSGAWC